MAHERVTLFMVHLVLAAHALQPARQAAVRRRSDLAMTVATLAFREADPPEEVRCGAARGVVGSTTRPPHRAHMLLTRGPCSPQVVPNVILTRSVDGSTGTATFKFAQASVLDIDSVWKDGLIEGLFLSDEEGTVSLRCRSCSAHRSLSTPTHRDASPCLLAGENDHRYQRGLRARQPGGHRRTSRSEERRRMGSLHAVDAAICGGARSVV